MIRKIILTALVGVAALTLSLSLTACGNEAPEQETVAAASQPSQTPQPPGETPDDATEAPTAPLADDAPEAAAFDFVFGGTVISLNQNMAEVLDALGEPTGMRQTPSCAFEGYDRIFGFGAINVHTYPLGDEDFVQIISIRDDSVTTPGGIRLGDSWERVVAVYGEDYAQDFNIFTFGLGDTTLSLYVDDGVVLEITYALVME